MERKSIWSENLKYGEGERRRDGAMERWSDGAMESGKRKEEEKEQRIENMLILLIGIWIRLEYIRI